MASTNGILSPPTQPNTNTDLTLSAKRKRDDSIDQPALINGINNDSKQLAIPRDVSKTDGQQLIQDLFDVLKR